MASLGRLDPEDRATCHERIAVSLPLFLQGLGSVGVFASRAFLPAFVTALLLRLGPEGLPLAHRTERASRAGTATGGSACGRLFGWRDSGACDETEGRARPALRRRRAGHRR